MIQHSHCVDLFGAHGPCWGGDVLMVWLHTLSDSLISFSYFAIPAVLLYLARKYRVKRLSGVFQIYAAFILLCGVTHVFDVLTVWYANYWIYLADGSVRALTGLVSLMAAYVTFKCTPFALVAFTRLAVFERQANERVTVLSTNPRYDTPEDRDWKRHLQEMADLARRARAVVPTEES